MAKTPGRPIRAYPASQLEKMGCGAKAWIIRQGKKHNIDSIKGIVGGNEAQLYLFRCLPPEWKAKVDTYERQQKQTSQLAALNKQHLDELRAMAELPMDDMESREFLWDEFEKKSNKKREGAIKKTKAVMAFYERKDGYGMKIGDALNATALEFEVTPLTVRNWVDKCKGLNRTDRVCALVGQQEGGKVKVEFTPEAWKYFKKNYLRRERRSIAACYRDMKEEAKKYGWVYPIKRTVENWIKREIDPMVIKYRREGMEAVEKCFPAMQRNVEMFDVMEAVNGDGYELGLWADFGHGVVVKPIVWTWQDIRSSKILTWRMDVSENRELLRLSILDLITNHSIPTYFWIDNTHAAASKQITGGLPNRYRFKLKDDEPMGLIPMIGAEYKPTLPGHGRSKPVERIHGIGGYLDFDSLPVFVGRGTKSRPIPIAEIEEVFASFVNEINARPDRQGAAVMGKSFDQVFNELYPEAVITKATEKQRKYCMCVAEVVRVSKTDASITLKAGKASWGENRYWHEALTSFMGKNVTVRFDPTDMHKAVYVETLAGDAICCAEPTITGGFKDAKAAREVARASGHFKKAVKNAAELEEKLTSAEARAAHPTIPAPEKPVPGKVTRIMTGKKNGHELPFKATVNGDYAGVTPDMEQNYNEAVKMMMESKKGFI